MFHEETHIHSRSLLLLLFTCPPLLFSWISRSKKKKKWENEGKIIEFFFLDFWTRKKMSKIEAAIHYTLFFLRERSRKKFDCRRKILMIRFCMLFSSFFFLLLLPYYYHWYNSSSLQSKEACVCCKSVCIYCSLMKELSNGDLLVYYSLFFSPLSFLIIIFFSLSFLCKTTSKKAK